MQTNLIKLNTYKLERGGLLVDMYDQFNARVGDQGTPLVIQWTQGTTDTPVDLQKNKLHFYAAGQVGKYLEKLDDGTGYKMSADASSVEYDDKDSAGTQANGLTVAKLPKQFFPQEGIFYGYFGLKDDQGNTYTSVNVWFRVLGGVPIMGAAIPYFSTRFDELMETCQGRVEDALAQLRSEYQAEVQKNEDMSAETRAALSKLADAVGAIQAQIDAGNVVTLIQHNADIKRTSEMIENKLAQMSLQPEAFENEAALKAKYPNGKPGIMVTVDTGHKYIWANSTWTDAGIYQSVGIAENSLDLTKISFDASKLIGWDENKINISPTGIQATGTPITITFNKNCVWTLSGNMVNYLSGETVEKTIPDGCALYLDITKANKGDNCYYLTTDSYIIAKTSDMPQRWSNVLLAINFGGRLLSPVQALQNKLSRIYYRTVPVSSILFYAPDNQDPIKIEDHTGNGATITFNAKTVIYSNNCSRYAYFDADMSFDLADGQSLILSWLDAPDGDPQGKLLTAGDFTVGKAVDIASDYKHHLLLSYLGHKLVSHNVSLQIAIDHYYRKDIIDNSVITVGKGYKYATIQAAVNAAADSKDNPITILIMPGIYNESVNVQGQRHLSLIGVNKKTCIVRYDTGYYNDAPLEIEGDVLVKNLTFISTHDATTNVPVDSLRSYAVHADFDGAGTAEFVDCDMISMQNAAFGCGLHQDQTVKLIRCNLFSHTPAESSMLINGSLYCHSAVAADTTNQHLIVDDCHVESDLSWATYINDANQTNGDKTGTDMDVAFYNTLFYSHEKGKTGVIHKDSGTRFSGTIKLNPMSYGNNLPELNA